jgi:hypothetical protein
MEEKSRIERSNLSTHTVIRSEKWYTWRERRGVRGGMVVKEGGGYVVGEV